MNKKTFSWNKQVKRSLYLALTVIVIVSFVGCTLEKKKSDDFLEPNILLIVAVDQMDIETTMIAANILHDSILSNTGVTFEQAARLYSLDRTSSEAGGDLGTVPLKLWLPALAEAALLLEEGSVSEPVYLSDAGAVVLLKIYDDSGEIDWSTYTDAELSGIVQQVIYHDTYTTIIDSLRKEIPVIYYLNTDDDSAN